MHIYHLGIVDDAEGNFRDAFGNFLSAEQQDAHFHPALLKLAEYFLAGDQYAPANQRIDSVLADAPDDAQGRALLAARFLRQKQYSDAENEARRSLKSDPNNILAYGVLTGIYRAQNDLAKATSTIEDGVARNPKSETLVRLKAEIYEQQGDLQKTAAAYRALFVIAPMEDKYRLNLANDYIKAGQIDQAEEVLREGVTALPDDWEMKHQMVLFLTSQRSVASAEQELLSYIKSNPDNSEPVDWLVDLYLTHNRADQADAFLSKIIDQNERDQLWIHAMTARAKIDYINRDTDGASKLVATVLATDPNNLDAQFLKAHLETDQGFYDQATIDLRSIIRDKPQANEAYELLSEILLKQGHTDLAIETLNQLSELTIPSLPQQVRLAQLNAINGDPKHARDLLLIATKTDPAYPVGWEMTARLSLDLKDWSTAEASIDTLDALPSQHLTALLLHGEELSARGKYPEAINAYASVISADPNAPQTQYALPALLQTYQIQNQLPEAARFLETLKPPTPLISTLLGETYLAIGNTDKAADAFDQAIANRPSHQDAYLDRAKIWISRHKPEAAIALLEQASATDPADPRARLAEAQLQEQNGDYSTALRLYTELLDKHPDSDVIANNLAEEIAGSSI